VALLEKRRFLYNHSGDFPQVILIIPSHVPNSLIKNDYITEKKGEVYDGRSDWKAEKVIQ
jgi:hypothetical protein